MKKLTILILTVIICHFNVQAGVLCGAVVNDIDNKPVEGVIIWLENTGFADTTDLDGNFLIKNIPAGKYTIIMEHPGFMQKAIPDFIIDESTISECVADCNGVLGGTAYLDSCQTCVGGNTGLEPCIQDCNGDWGGTAYRDNCQTCVGGSTGMEPCIVSGISDEVKNEIVFFFNNSEQVLYIKNTPPGIAVVYDLLGRSIVTKEINQKNEKINIPTLKPGIYLFVLKSNDGVVYTNKIRL